MEILLYLLLCIIFYYIIKAALFIHTIYRRMHEATRQFREFGSAAGSHGRATASDYSNSTSRSNTDGSTYGGHSDSAAGASSRTSVVEEIYDTRPDEIRSRKIISSDEGEYVDFVEE